MILFIKSLLLIGIEKATIDAAIVLILVALWHGCFTHSVTPFHWTTARPSHDIGLFSEGLCFIVSLGGSSVKTIVELCLRLILITAMMVKSAARNSFIFGLLRLLCQLGEDLNGTLSYVRIHVWLLLTINLEFAKSRV